MWCLINLLVWTLTLFEIVSRRPCLVSLQYHVLRHLSIFHLSYPPYSQIIICNQYVYLSLGGYNDCYYWKLLRTTIVFSNYVRGQYVTCHCSKINHLSVLLLVWMVTVIIEFGGTCWVEISPLLLTNAVFITVLLVVSVGVLWCFFASIVSKISSPCMTSSVNGAFHTSHCMFSLSMSREVFFIIFLLTPCTPKPRSVSVSESSISSRISFAIH